MPKRLAKKGATILIDDILRDIKKEYELAVEKHPHFPDDQLKQVAKMIEEALEAFQEANDIDDGNGSIENLIKELLQTGAMVVRCLSRISRIE